LVFVDIIERKTGIETISPTDFDAATESARDFQTGARNCEFCVAVTFQAVVLGKCVSDFVGAERRRSARGARKASQDKPTHKIDNLTAVRFVKNGVAGFRKHFETLLK